MRCRVRQDFGIEKREYRAGEVAEFTDDQAARLPDLLEPITGEDKPGRPRGPQGRFQGRKNLGEPPAHKMVTGATTK